MTISEKDRRGRLEQLFEQHYAAILSYALRRAPRDVAEDVASETFVVIARRLDDVPADALPWLYGVARRVLANERRGEARRGRLAGALESSAPAVHLDPTPLDGEDVIAALARLPEPEREALMLTAWEGLSTAEAATAAGCSRVAMRARLSRGRRRLSGLLKDPGQAAQPSPVPPRAMGGASCTVIERSHP